MAKEPLIVHQIDAVQMKIEAEGKLTINSKMLPEVAKWKTGEVYRLTIVDIIQTANRVLSDGVIEADFEITGTESDGRSAS